MLSNIAFSQIPPPPPGGGHGQTGNEPGGGAPLSSGLTILMALVAAYGGRKIYQLSKKMDEKSSGFKHLVSCDSDGA